MTDSIVNGESAEVLAEVDTANARAYGLASEILSDTTPSARIFAVISETLGILPPNQGEIFAIVSEALGTPMPNAATTFGLGAEILCKPAGLGVMNAARTGVVKVLIDGYWQPVRSVVLR